MDLIDINPAYSSFEDLAPLVVDVDDPIYLRYRDNLRSRNPSLLGGKFYTQGLFTELAKGKDVPHLSLTRRGITEKWGRTIYPLRDIYLALEDPTEYKVALYTLGSWDHWKKILANPDIKFEIDSMREELELKLMSKGIEMAIENATGVNGNFQASKWLASKGWANGKGRPSKEAIAKTEKQMSTVAEFFREDLQRIGKEH